MIKQSLYLDDYYWSIDVYYAVDCYYVDSIVRELRKMGCPKNELEEIRFKLSSCSLNKGLTYSDINNHHTLIIIELTGSAAEFANSLVHEIAHVAQHIGESFYLDPYGEEVCYLQGELMRSMFQRCSYLLCQHCRTAVQHRPKCCTDLE